MPLKPFTAPCIHFTWKFVGSLNGITSYGLFVTLGKCNEWNQIHFFFELVRIVFFNWNPLRYIIYSSYDICNRIVSSPFGVSHDFFRRFPELLILIWDSILIFSFPLSIHFDYWRCSFEKIAEWIGLGVHTSCGWNALDLTSALDLTHLVFHSYSLRHHIKN